MFALITSGYMIYTVYILLVKEVKRVQLLPPMTDLETQNLSVDEVDLKKSFIRAFLFPLCVCRRGQVNAGATQRPPSLPSGRGHAADRPEQEPTSAPHDEGLERGGSTSGGGEEASV